MSTLFIIATPIGNLSDITLRALETLKSLDVLYAEDKRVTSKLLNHHDIRVPELKTYNQHSSIKVRQGVAEDIIAGKKIGLVTDAGTPGISDPGNELIEFVLGQIPDVRIVPIPGASALTTTLSVSGMNANRFVFLGFLPKRKRQKLFKWLKDGELTFAFYESPNRIIKSLETVKEYFGEVEVVVARELTKMHERVYRGSIGEVLRLLESEKVKGEIVVVVSQ